MPDGGCLCGGIRYRLDGRPLDAGFCHCTLCRRSTGAPVVAWGTWHAEALSWLGAQPRTFRSSPKGMRWFCPACGTQLAFAHADAPSLIDITLSSLDDPEAVGPEYHIWVRSQIGWLQMADGLPRHEDGGPDEQLMGQPDTAD